MGSYPLQRRSRCILQPQPTGQVYSWVATVSCPIERKCQVDIFYLKVVATLGIKLRSDFFLRWSLQFSLLKKWPSLHFSLLCRVQKNPLPLTHANELLDLQFSLVIFNFNECLLLFADYCLLYLFIYSFNFLWAVQLRYISSNTLYTSSIQIHALNFFNNVTQLSKTGFENVIKSGRLL